MRIYTVLLTQSTEGSAPSVDVLDNTLCGLPVWTRTEPGVFRASLKGAFTGKVFFVCPVIAGSDDTNLIFSWAEKESDDSILFVTCSATNGNSDWARQSNLPQSFEVRVYQ